MCMEIEAEYRTWEDGCECGFFVCALKMKNGGGVCVCVREQVVS